MKVVCILFLFAFMSCRKTYNCVCKNASSSASVGNITGTKSKAKQVCESTPERAAATYYTSCSIE